MYPFLELILFSGEDFGIKYNIIRYISKKTTWRKCLNTLSSISSTNNCKTFVTVESVRVDCVRLLHDLERRSHVSTVHGPHIDIHPPVAALCRPGINANPWRYAAFSTAAHTQSLKQAHRGRLKGPPRDWKNTPAEKMLCAIHTFS